MSESKGVAGQHDIAAEVRLYLTVFAALAILTVATAGVSYLEMPRSASIVAALAIAITKVVLIGAFFMHLTSERGMIRWSLAVCVGLVLALLAFVVPDVGVHPAEKAMVHMTPAQAERAFREAMGIAEVEHGGGVHGEGHAGDAAAQH